MENEIKDLAILNLIEKSKELGKSLVEDWEQFRVCDIYKLMTPDGFVKGSEDVVPRKKHYRVGSTYVAWSTYPTSSFDFIGMVVCVKSWWEEVCEHEPGTKIVGYRPMGIFKKADGKQVTMPFNFITTKEIKDAVDEALEAFR